MKRISEEAKQSIIKKVLSKNGQKTAEIALTNNIGYSTLNKWMKSFRAEKKLARNEKPAPGSSTAPIERFRHLQATFGQESAMVGAYCRKNGLYPHQLTQWEADFMATPASKKDLSKAELKILRTENKALKHIIVRKDKVLAETVALLVLKKKAAQIWGGSEED